MSSSCVSPFARLVGGICQSCFIAVGGILWAYSRQRFQTKDSHCSGAGSRKVPAWRFGKKRRKFEGFVLGRGRKWWGRAQKWWWHWEKNYGASGKDLGWNGDCGRRRFPRRVWVPSKGRSQGFQGFQTKVSTWRFRVTVKVPSKGSQALGVVAVNVSGPTRAAPKPIPPKVPRPRFTSKGCQAIPGKDPQAKVSKRRFLQSSQGSQNCVILFLAGFAAQGFQRRFAGKGLQVKVAKQRLPSKGPQAKVPK